MPYKDLEHDGNEDFLGTFPNREEHNKKTFEIKAELDSEERKEKELAKAQAKWLSPENPFLWNGEI